MMSNVTHRQAVRSLTRFARWMLASAAEDLKLLFQNRPYANGRQGIGSILYASLPPHRSAPQCSNLSVQSRQGCSCALALEEVKATLPPQPGSVKDHSHHIMIRIPPPTPPLKDSQIWWPPIMEKHPALVQAFAGVAEAKQRLEGALEGVVKVTAYEHMDGFDKSGDQTRVEMLFFPEAVRYKGVPHDKIKEIVRHQVMDVSDGSHSVAPPQMGRKTSKEAFDGIGLFVCTHMSRDNRCGVLGAQLARRLSSLVDGKGLDMVKVFQASHVGGHKFAGNVLCHGSVSPCDGDWYGGITKDNAEGFLDALVNIQVGCDGGAEDGYLRRYWRGRMNLSKEEQLCLFEGSTHASETESDTDSSSSDGDTTN